MFKRIPKQTNTLILTETHTATTLRCTRITIALLMSLTVPFAFAFEGDVDPAFGTGGQIVIPRPNSDGINDKPTGDLVILGDGRFLWSAPLDNETIWVGRNWRNGTADSTFGSEGNGRITLPACGERFRPVRLIGDGASGAILWSDRCLRRILDNGTLDSSFGLGSMPPSSFIAADLARDPSGRLLLAGRDGQLSKVYRFDEDGAIDIAFGTAGSVVLIPPVGVWKSVNALVIRPDGRILVGGSGGADHEKNLFVAQLRVDGSPDFSWDADGFVVLDPPPTFHTIDAEAMALDADGSLVVSGTGNNSSSSCCYLLTRLAQSGEVVPAFGLRLFGLSGSPTVWPFGERRGDIVILPNHRIIIGTTSFPSAHPVNHRTQFTLIRTFANGSLDPGFGHDGWNSYTIVESAGASPSGDYNQMHASGYDQEDGSILILGRTFFEDLGSRQDYISMVRARFDLIFDDTFD